MAHPKIIVETKDTIFYSLSNKPEWVCVIDRKDYYNFVHNTNHWYIHIRTDRRSKKTGGIRQKSTPYIRCTNSNGSHNHLHRIILVGDKPFSRTSVIDHRNRYGLDNRRDNIHETDSRGNNQNCVRIRSLDSFEYRGVWVTFLGSRNKYQVYHEGRFVGGSVSKAEIIRKVDKFLDGAA